MLAAGSDRDSDWHGHTVACRCVGVGHSLPRCPSRALVSKVFAWHSVGSVAPVSHPYQVPARSSEEPVQQPCTFTLSGLNRDFTDRFTDFYASVCVSVSAGAGWGWPNRSPSSHYA